MVDFERIKIFVIYLVNEPIRNLGYIYSSLGKIIKLINKPVSWFWLCAYISLYSAFYRKSMLGGFSLLTLIAYIFMLWNSGDWMYEYRKKKGYNLGKGGDENA